MSKKPRSCVVCRERKTKSELLRVVRREGGAVVLDVDGNSDGRGAYVCRSAECINLAIKKHAFNRAFKKDVGKAVYDELGDYLKNIH